MNEVTVTEFQNGGEDPAMHQSFVYGSKLSGKSSACRGDQVFDSQP